MKLIEINNLTKIFFHPKIKEIIIKEFQKYGKINRVVQEGDEGKLSIIYTKNINLRNTLKEIKFKREEIIQIYKNLDLEVTDELVDDHLDEENNLVIEIKYLEKNIDLNSNLEEKYLKLPDLTKNWLISPPGSPPIGWEPKLEDKPNEKNLSDDLFNRLTNLNLNLNDNDNNNNNNNNEILIIPAQPELKIPALKIHSVESHLHLLPSVKIPPTSMPTL